MYKNNNSLVVPCENAKKGKRMKQQTNTLRNNRLLSILLVCAVFTLIMLSASTISKSYAATSYNVWIDGQEVTDEDLGSLDNNGWSYEPESSTLTLSYKTLTATAKNEPETDFVGIRSNYIISYNEVLNLVIIGENHINMEDDTFGILCFGDLNISGNGTLEITDHQTFMNDIITAKGNVTLGGKAQISISGGEYGIIGSSLAVNGGRLQIEAGNDEKSALLISGDTTIDESMEIKIPDQSSGFNISGKSILIEPRDQDYFKNTLDTPDPAWGDKGVVSWNAVEDADRYKVVVDSNLTNSITYWITVASLDMATKGRSDFIDALYNEESKQHNCTFDISVTAYAKDGNRSDTSTSVNGTLYYMTIDSSFIDPSHTYVHRAVGEDMTLNGIDDSHKEYFEKYFDDPVWVLSDDTNTKEIAGDSCTFVYGTDHCWKNAKFEGTPKTVNITLDAGEGHEELAAAVADALSETYSVTVNGTIVTIQTPVCEKDGTELTSEALVNDIDSAVKKESSLYNGKLYKGIDDVNGKDAKAYKYIDVLDSGISLKIHWKTALSEIRIGIELPESGASITTSGSNIQSPSPTVIFADSSVVQLTEGEASPSYYQYLYENPRIQYYKFIDSEDDEYDRWEWSVENFAITNGESYQVELYFGEKDNYDYCIDSSNPPLVYVNGELINPKFENDRFYVDYEITAHSWGEITYTVSEDKKTVTARRTAADDPLAVQEETADVTLDVTKSATCEEPGTANKIAEFKNPLFETQTVETDIEVPATGHDWGAPAYTWSKDYSSVTATCICKNDSTHVATETVKTTSAVTKKATYTAKGKTTYTAVFTNPLFTKQTKVLTNIAKLAKKANTLTVKAKTVKLKYKKLKKKNLTITAKKTYQITKAKGKKSFKLAGVTKKKFKKYFKVNKKTGKITVRKKLKKGTYKVRVKITAAGTTAYKAKSQTVTVKVKVK